MVRINHTSLHQNPGTTFKKATNYNAMISVLFTNPSTIMIALVCCLTSTGKCFAKWSGIDPSNTYVDSSRCPCEVIIHHT